MPRQYNLFIFINPLGLEGMILNVFWEERE